MSSCGRRPGPSAASSPRSAPTSWRTPRARRRSPPQAENGRGLSPRLHPRRGLTHTGMAVTKAAQNPAARRYVDARPRAFAGIRRMAPPDSSRPDSARCHCWTGVSMIILGIILLVAGFLLKIAILWTIGILVLVAGLILALLGAVGHAVGGRRHYW